MDRRSDCPPHADSESPTGLSAEAAQQGGSAMAASSEAPLAAADEDEQLSRTFENNALLIANYKTALEIASQKVFEARVHLEQLQNDQLDASTPRGPHAAVSSSSYGDAGSTESCKQFESLSEHRQLKEKLALLTAMTELVRKQGRCNSHTSGDGGSSRK
eukprot:Filipodium_phascolosomae@DN1166_c0_g1_i1.p1